MADFQKIILELEVRSKNAEQEVARLEGVVSRLKKSTIEADKNMLKFAQQGLKQAALNAKVVNAELKQTQQQMSKTQRSTGYLGTSIAYLASDMGFLAQNPRMGLLAIGNNLSQVAIAMQHAAKEAGSMGKALRVAFITQGWMIVLQLGIAFLTQWHNIFKSTTKEAEQLTKQAKLASIQLDFLQNILNKRYQNEILRKNVLERMKQLGVDFKSLRKDEMSDLVKLNELIDQQKRDIIARAQAKGLEAKLDELISKQQKGYSLGFVDYIKIISQAFVDMLQITSVVKRTVNQFWNSLLDGADWFYQGFKAYLMRMGVDVSGWSLTIREGLGTLKDTTSDMVDVTFAETMRLIKRLRGEGNEEIATGIEELLTKLQDLYSNFNLYGSGGQGDEGYTKDFAANFMGGILQDQVVLKIQQNLDILDALRQQDLVNEEDYVQAKKVLMEQLAKYRRDTAADEVSTLGKTFQQLAEGNKKLGGLAIAGIILEQASSVAKIWSALPETKAKYDAAYAGIPVVGPVIAGGLKGVATLNAVAGTALAIKRAKDGISKIKGATGASGGTAGGNARPSFNIVGSTGTNQIQSSLENQTSEIQAINKSTKVQLVTDELEVAQADNKVALEASSIG